MQVHFQEPMLEEGGGGGEVYSQQVHFNTRRHGYSFVFQTNKRIKQIGELFFHTASEESQAIVNFAR